MNSAANFLKTANTRQDLLQHYRETVIKIILPRIGKLANSREVL